MQKPDGVSLASCNLGGIWPPNGRLKLWALLGRCQEASLSPWSHVTGILTSWPHTSVTPRGSSASSPRLCREASPAGSSAHVSLFPCIPEELLSGSVSADARRAHEPGPPRTPLPRHRLWALPPASLSSQSHQLLRALLPASWAQRDHRALLGLAPVLRPVNLRAPAGAPWCSGWAHDVAPFGGGLALLAVGVPF